MLEVTEYRLRTFLFRSLVFSPSWMLSSRNDGFASLGQFWQFRGNKAFIGLWQRQHRKQKARTRHQFKDLFSDIIKSYCTVVFLSTISIIFFFTVFTIFFFAVFSLFLFEIVLFYIIHQAIFSLVVSLEEKAATNTHNSWIMINIFFFVIFPSFFFKVYIRSTI